MCEPSADLAQHFADLAYGTAYSDLPADAIDAAKKTILDTLGVSLAASGLEASVGSVLEYAREIGGRSEASVIASDAKLPAGAAAFVNGAMAHCLDFDDYTYWGHHAASSIVPAAFAVAERAGGISGEEMITAVAVGQDIFGRLRRFVEWQQDWNISPVMGVFAAAATASRVLHLSREETFNALGIATMQSSGTMEVVRGTSDLRGIYAGFSAQGAVVATLLSEKGISGLDAPFEGKYGFLNTYFAGKYDRGKILERLGTEFTGSATLYKRWASVSTSHSHIHATLGLVEQHDLAVDDIEEIRVYTGDWHDVMCQPLEARRAPTSALDGKFSLPFLVASAAVRRKVGVADFTTEALNDPRVLAVAQRVVPVPDRTLDWKLEIPSGRVEIITRDGRSYEAAGANVPGTVDAPLTWDDLGRKFDDCAAAAAVPLSQDQASMIKRLVQDLETLDDVTVLMAALSGSED
jgi:2-methylcitrate dehydratase PrpD